jgi:hypothetical protein
MFLHIFFLLPDYVFSLKPKHGASNKTDKTVDVNDYLYFLYDATYMFVISLKVFPIYQKNFPLFVIRLCHSACTLYMCVSTQLALILLGPD